MVINHVMLVNLSHVELDSGAWIPFLPICFRNKKATNVRIKMMPIGKPRVPYRTPGEDTWQWVDLWNALYRERVIFIGQNIDEEFSNQILATMLYLDSLESSEKLYLYINGPGGDLTPSMAIYDTVRSLKSSVGTSRLAMPLSRIALQSPAGCRGCTWLMIFKMKPMNYLESGTLFNELAAKTGQPVEKVISCQG